MPRLFGTDGVRGVANQDLTPDLALTLGRAAGLVLVPGSGAVVLGRDTRLSGPMLEAALVAGLCSAGVTVLTAGVVPTPAVAWLTLADKAEAGAAISASHNPVPDNGIKFFNDEGMKVPPETEEAIERRMADPPGRLPVGAGVGTAQPLDAAADRYGEHLLEALEASLAGLKVVLDCAYGAAWEVGPSVFVRAGADVVTMHAEPDGARINVDCGSTSLTRLAARVVETGADLGLGFDGDADRVLAVDERGAEVDGDRIMAMWALRLSDAGALDNGVVVTTVMANLGFRRALEERGIQVIAAPVGDRNVARAMYDHRAVLGGEQSGHVIFARYATTGDGILTGLKVAEAVKESGERLSALADVFTPYPQVLINVRVAAKEGLDSVAALWDEVAAVESELGEEGRVLLRASGTEPVVRVMVEAARGRVARNAAERLAGAVRTHLG